MRVDVHTHVQPPDYVTALLDSGRYQVERGENDVLIVKQQGARVLTLTSQQLDLEQRLAAMDRLGIDVQVLSLSTPNVYFLEGQPAADLARMCNDDLAGIVQQAPTRFRALASVPLTAGVDAAIAELARCMDELGMPGFIIGTNIDGVPLDDPRFGPLFEEANRRNAIMFVHPMTPPGLELLGQYALAPLVGFPLDTTLALARLIFSDFFGRFLGITVIAAHLGGTLPFLAGRLDAGWRAYPECQRITRPPSEVLERLYFDTVTTHEPALRCALDTVGEERLLFGSDYPQVIGDPRAGIEAVERVVGRWHRGKVLGDTAARLFGLER